ncbi:MAG: hypothetical protein KH094_09855 [Haemophilus parainfluenzae]|nr:hypothetical protein [Haemophilus parainfluenzae]
MSHKTTVTEERIDDLARVHRLSRNQLADATGLTAREYADRKAGLIPFTAGEIDRLARLLRSPSRGGGVMKVKDLYWAARNSTFFINLESEGRPLLCEPRLSDEGGVRIRLWLRDPAGTGTGGAIALLSRDEAAVLANAIDTRRNWVGEKADDALPRIGVSATVDSTMIRFMECRGEGHIALTVTEAGRLASWLHDMADGRWRDHNGYVPEVVK